MTVQEIAARHAADTKHIVAHVKSEAHVQGVEVDKVISFVAQIHADREWLLDELARWKNF